MLAEGEAARASDVVATLHAHDPSARALGIEVVRAAAGAATVEMRITAEMCNGLGTCHGGMLFTIADSAMAFASNSHDEVAVAVTASIEFLAPAHAGDVVRATCEERWLRGRTGIYDTVVSLADGSTVAIFRGRTQRVGGSVVDRVRELEDGREASG